MFLVLSKREDLFVFVVRKINYFSKYSEKTIWLQSVNKVSSPVLRNCLRNSINNEASGYRMTKVGSFLVYHNILLFSPESGLKVGAQKSKVQSPIKLYIVFKVFIKEKE